MAIGKCIPLYYFNDSGHTIVTDDPKLGRWMRAEDVNAMFEVGVAYMPVPRCETCKHWGPFTDGSGAKECRKVHALDTKIRAAYEELMVADDFGCVQWEAK
jgi:hypothetical protein